MQGAETDTDYRSEDEKAMRRNLRRIERETRMRLERMLGRILGFATVLIDGR